jgi:predicted PurR-regulated permease PerM
MQTEDIQITSRSNPSQRVIALGIVFAFLYFASSVVITLLLAVLAAYFLDPVVGLLEKIHIPRALGALMVLAAVTGGSSRAVYAGLAPLQRGVATRHHRSRP